MRTLRPGRHARQQWLSMCTAAGPPSKVSIGGVSVTLQAPQFRELVPSGFKMAGGDSQETLAHLRCPHPRCDALSSPVVALSLVKSRRR